MADHDPNHDDFADLDPTTPDDVHSAQAGQDAETPVPDPVEQAIAQGAQHRRQFEELTLAQAIIELLAAPQRTWGKIHAIATTPRMTPISVTGNAPGTQDAASQALPYYPELELERPAQRSRSAPQPVFDPEVAYIEEVGQRQREALLLGLRLTAFIVAWIGNASLTSVARSGRFETVQSGLVYLGLALLLWIGVEVFDAVTGGKPKSPSYPSDTATADDTPDTFLHPVRFALAAVGTVALGATVLIHLSVTNQFTAVSFFTWMVSIVAFSGALASQQTLFQPYSFQLRIPPFWRSRTFYALLAIVLVGTYFRLAYLDRTPPQMTSDHVEKLLDAQRVLDGNTQVFFPNNGGREPFQMYAMALLSQVPGLGMNFFTLKLLSALEGIITLPFLWWMGRAVIGEEYPRFGNAVGLALAALVAVSGWHLALSRLALRIVLTPLIASLVLIYLGRGMRYNRRDDWLKAGLALGAGLYMYQAVRMLPVVIIVGLVIAVIMRARSAGMFTRYAVNFASLVFISSVVFTPMLVFALQAPELFWRRTAGRLFGDSTIQETLDDGSIVSRDPSIAEQLEAFQANLPVLTDNIKNVVLMFNWKGDVAWINNAPNYPQMDDVVGALFVLGLVSWGGRMFRRRDPVDWLVPIMLFIMLMPSALAIAFPVENPSATRTSGALPVAYLIAVYPVALMIRSIMRLSDRRGLTVALSALLLGVFCLGSYLQNADMYFNRYHSSYLLSSLPYEQAGDDITAFNTATNTTGNTFMIAYRHWWDHRALGIAANMIDYPNGITALEEVPQFMYDSFLAQSEYSYEPEEDILFFHSVEDTETLQQLREWFPQGESEFVEIESQRRSYAMYRVPALGTEPFLGFSRQVLAGDGIE